MTTHSFICWGPNLRVFTLLVALLSSSTSNPSANDIGYTLKKNLLKKLESRASLVAQWLRICLSMQGTQVQSLVWEDPTGCGATKPTHHSYWVCALEPGNRNCWGPWTLERMLSNKRHHHENPACRNYKGAPFAAEKAQHSQKIS